MKSVKQRSALFLFALAFAAYGSIYVARLNFSVAASALEDAGRLNRSQIGIIGSVFSIVFAAAKVPNGYLGDRFSTRRIILMGLLLVGASNIVIGLFPTFLVIALLWGLNAYGQSMLWGPMLRSISTFSEGEQAKKLAQYLTSSLGVGTVVGLWGATIIVPMWGISWGFILPGILCFTLAAMVRLFFVDVPSTPVARREKMLDVTVRFIRDRKFRQIIAPALAHGVVKDNVNVWMVIFFVDTYGVDLSKLGGYVFFVPFCTLAGRLLFPLCYRAVKSTKVISAASYACTAVCSILLCIPGLPMWAGLVCMGAIAAFASLINTHLVSMFPMEEYGSESLSFATGIIDLMIYGGAGLSSLVFGYMIESFGFFAMFLVWAAASLLSVFFVLKKVKNS